MSNDLANNKAHGQPGSVTDQTCKVFGESSVCAVSTILSTDNKPRKIFRSVVFSLFTFAFLYQFIAFLSYALQYPSVVDFEVSREDKFLSPAYSFCNFNPIKRSKFCAKYPNNCTKPGRKFCDEHPRFCGTPDTLILKEDNFEFDSMDEFFLLNHDAEDMADFGSDEEDIPVGPLPRSNPHESYTHIGACFTFNDRVNSHLDPYMKMLNPLGRIMGERTTFDPQENEVIYPDATAGIMFQVHSPFEPVNPYENGYFMKPGYIYRIAIKMTQEELLPYNCLNYTEVWLKNGKTGYRSQAACKLKCIGDVMVECLNCTEPLILYHYPNITFCTRDVYERKHTGMCEDPKDAVKECMDACKDDCVKVQFDYEVKESHQNRNARFAEKNESREITVKIEYPEETMRKIIHKPQFQALQIFSLIGGLLAFWIGLSMFQVVEVFDCIFQIGKYLFNKRTAGSESSAA